MEAYFKAQEARNLTATMTDIKLKEVYQKISDAAAEGEHAIIVSGSDLDLEAGYRLIDLGYELLDDGLSEDDATVKISWRTVM